MGPSTPHFFYPMKKKVPKLTNQKDARRKNSYKRVIVVREKILTAKR
jgi:hypothetical protein